MGGMALAGAQLFLPPAAAIAAETRPNTGLVNV
jgi:hypothetical protein